MKMRCDPDHRHRERDHEDEKEEPAFTALLAERTRATALPTAFAEAFVLERDGDIEALASFIGPLQKFFPLTARFFCCDAWRFFDHALQIVHLLAQILLESGELQLLLIQRRVG